MEEIITVNGIEYKMETSAPLTQEQKNEVIKQVSIKSTDCSTCGGNNTNNIATLVTTCASPIKRGTTKNIPTTIDNAANLTSPFVYRLYTYGTLYATYPTTGTTTSTSYTFPNVPFNTAQASVEVKLTITDSCTGSTAGATTCNVAVQDPALDVVTALDPNNCSYPLNIGNTCTLTTTCTDQFGAAILCGTMTWSSNNTAIATVNSTTGVVTGVSVGSTTIKATAANGKFGLISVQISCATPACSFTL